MFTWVDVCSTQPLCRGIQSAFRRVTHQRPRRRRRRRVYFGPYRNNPDNNGMDQIVNLAMFTMDRTVTQSSTGRMPFLPPNQQRQSSEGTLSRTQCTIKQL